MRITAHRASRVAWTAAAVVWAAGIAVVVVDANHGHEIGVDLLLLWVVLGMSTTCTAATMSAIAELAGTVVAVAYRPRDSEESGPEVRHLRH